MAFKSDSGDGGAAKVKYNARIRKKLFDNIAEGYTIALDRAEQDNPQFLSSATGLKLLAFSSKLIDLVMKHKFNEASQLIRECMNYEGFRFNVTYQEVFYFIAPFQNISLYISYLINTSSSSDSEIDENQLLQLWDIEGQLNIFFSSQNTFPLGASSTTTSSSSTAFSTPSTISTDSDPLLAYLQIQAGGGDDILDDPLAPVTVESDETEPVSSSDSADDGLDDGLDDLVPDEFEEKYKQVKSGFLLLDKALESIEDNSLAVETIVDIYSRISHAMALLEGEADTVSDDTSESERLYDRYILLQNAYLRFFGQLTTMQTFEELTTEESSTLSTLQSNAASLNIRFLNLRDRLTTQFSTTVTAYGSMADLASRGLILGGMAAITYFGSGGTGGSV